MSLIKNLGDCMVVIIISIGFISLVSVMIASVISTGRKFVILQSVELSNKYFINRI